MAIMTIKPVDGCKEMYAKLYIPDEVLEKYNIYFTSALNANVSIEYKGKDEKDNKVSGISN